MLAMDPKDWHVQPSVSHRALHKVWHENMKPSAHHKTEAVTGRFREKKKENASERLLWGSRMKWRRSCRLERKKKIVPQHVSRTNWTFTNSFDEFIENKNKTGFNGFSPASEIEECLYVITLTVQLTWLKKGEACYAQHSPQWSTCLCHTVVILNAKYAVFFFFFFNKQNKRTNMKTVVLSLRCNDVRTIGK